MRFISIELKGYKRLLLNHTNYIKITFTEKLQLILGSNGSGKSSLMAQLNPLPATPSEFMKDGYKIVMVEHNRSIYKLESYFSPIKHSFYKDGGDNLNPGGTASVQKELVRKEFGITNEIHDLLTGLTNFTSMSPSDRRYWFTQLSDINYTYAIGVYKRLGDRLRDVNGAIKINQSRLIQETSKLLTIEQEDKLRNEIIEDKKFIDHLIDNKPNTNNNERELLNKLDSNEKLIIVLGSAIIRLRNRFINEESFNSLNDIDNAIINEQAKVNSLTNDITFQSKQFEHYEEQYKLLQKNQVNNNSDIDTSMQYLTERIGRLNKRVILKLEFSDIELANNSFLSVYENLTDIFTNLEPNPNKDYSRVNFQLLTEKTIQLKKDLESFNNANNKLSILKKEQEHYKEHNKLECPECNHKWIKDYNESQYIYICNQLTEVLIGTENTITNIKNNEESLNKIKDYFNVYKSFTDITKMWSILNPLWSHITGLETLFTNPSSIKHILNNVKLDLEIQKEINKLQIDLDSLIQLKALTDHNEQLNIDSIHKSLTDTENTLYNLNCSVDISKKLIKKYKDYKDIVNDINDKTITLEKLISDNSNKGKEIIDNYRKNAINDLIRVVQLGLTKKEQSLSEITIQKALVDNLKDQISLLENQSQSLKLLVKELSPTDGLIAKGMLGFINNFTKQINSFIKKIWLYPLKLIPCKPNEDDDVELDYKFGLSANGGDPVSDIKLGSTGMKEVIDLGFRLVAMKYFKLDDYPIYLDEFARTMDHAHKKAAFNVITNLIAQSTYPQIFLISHFEESYGSLVNAEIAVLCEANIIIPNGSTFNKHIIIR